MHSDDLANQTVLVTGSARGIGAATARLATERGARVVLHGRTKSEHLLALADELDAPYLVCDLADADALDAATDAMLAEIGQVHALINSAGIVNRVPFSETDRAHWRTEFETNLFGTVHMCQKIAPSMRAAGYGRIVNVGSMRGTLATPSERGMAYSASKAALHNFTVSLAKELAPAVTVNAVAPGFVETDMARSFPAQVRPEIASALVGRIGQPREIAELLVFLASPAASFITGQTIVADGGYGIAGK